MADQCWVNGWPMLGLWLINVGLMADQCWVNGWPMLWQWLINVGLQNHTWGPVVWFKIHHPWDTATPSTYKSQVSDSGQINVKMTHHTLYLTHSNTLAFGVLTGFNSNTVVSTGWPYTCQTDMPWHISIFENWHTTHSDTLEFGASTWFRSDKATAATVTFSTVLRVQQKGTTVPVSINGYALGWWRHCSKWPLTILAWTRSQQHAPVSQASCFQVGLDPCQSPACKEMM